MSYNRLLGERIKSIRLEKKYDENKVASEAKIPLWKYKSIEEGEYLLTLDLVTKISAALKISNSDILSCLGHLDVEEKIPPEIKSMLDLFYANKHLAEKIKLSETEYER